jgi:predicted nucleotide-binding protein
MWEYLENLGVLERGTDEEIKAAKKAYRKEYLLKYKQKQRSRRPEFTVSFSNEKGEYNRVEYAAKNHKMTITAFIRAATQAYISKTFVVPDRGQIAHIEQMLAQFLNEIKTIIWQKERFYWQREQKYEAIEKRISKLEEEIEQYIRQPLPVDEFVKRAVTNDPTLKEQIFTMLNL